MYEMYQTAVNAEFGQKPNWSTVDARRAITIGRKLQSMIKEFFKNRNDGHLTTGQRSPFNSIAGSARHILGRSTSQSN